MSLETLIEAFDAEIPIERAWTPPSGWYVSPEVYQLKQASVFKRSWQPVARVEQLKEAGSFVSGCLAGEPWVVVRGADHQLRAFYNTCRHKDREVVIGEGTAAELVCGYHAWTYDLDGRLRKAPRMAGIEDFDRETMSLRPLALEVWGPWVFVSRDLDARALRDGIVGLDKALEASE
ncbi:Rieske (2Fe-2S) protein [Endomicrobium sp. AH-315-J14]|nr:Rieske (2Fe-2S) protein [Endomicrobium sp. AH-315-J14]